MSSSNEFDRGAFRAPQIPDNLRDVKRTKILATVGPATSSPEMLRNMVLSGVNVFRINFSHGNHEQHANYLKHIRAVEAELGIPVAVCADLCGPKIRVGVLQNGKVHLDAGQSVVIQRDLVDGDHERFSTTLPELVDLIAVGDKLLLSDGRLKFEVTAVNPPDEFVCQVVVGGGLSSGKGVNLPNTNVPIAALTEKDLSDVRWIVQHDFDFVALSFVQRPDDITQLRSLLERFDCSANIIAKIEKPGALDQIDAIIAEADGVMVARGDLGVEIDLPIVPVAQKSIAHKCQEAGKPCIIATEMMESMIDSPTPTRAEVSDVANAVFDHADAVMLSAESAIGEYPVEVARAMSQTVFVAEVFVDDHSLPLKTTLVGPVTTAALAGAVRQIMKVQKISAVAMYTASGLTARIISKNRPACPVVALSSHLETVRRCCLYFGVISRLVDEPHSTADLLQRAGRRCKELGLAASGDRIIVVAGHPIGAHDRTNGVIIDTID